MELPVDMLPEILFAHRFSCDKGSWRLPKDESMLEISACLSGEMYRRSEAGEERFLAGELYVTDHCRSYDITTSEGHTHVTVALRRQSPGQLTAHLPERVNMAECPEGLKALIALAAADPDSLCAKTMAMVLLNALDACGRRLQKVDNPHYLKAVRYIHEHLAEATPDGAARAASVSKGYLESLFRAHGTTFVRYVNALRVSRAGQMMLAKEIPARCAAEQVGIGDPKYFSRLFRRYNGMSIRSFRAQHSL